MPNLTAEQVFRRTENRKRLDGLLIIAIVAVLWFIQLQPLFAADKVPGPYNAQVLSCNDGDTCKMRVPVWLDTYDPSPLNAAMLDETLACLKELYDVGKAIFTGRNHFEVT